MKRELNEKSLEYRNRGVPVLLTETLEFLCGKVKEFQPKNILEIGTAVGLSGSAMLLSAPLDAHLTTVEIDYERVEEAKKNFEHFGVSSRVTQFIGDAEEVVMSMDGIYDLIFLDGPKSKYLTYLPYLKSALAPNGALIADNVGFYGYIKDGSSYKHRLNTIVRNMRDFLSIIKEDADFISETYDIGDGILVAKKIR